MHKAMSDYMLQPQRSHVDMIYMESRGIYVRVPHYLRGKWWSVIHLGRCNFNCGYCKPGGFLPRAKKQVFPNSRKIPMNDVLAFVRNEALEGNLLKITGGEPTLDYAEVEAMIDCALAHGGYVCLDSNGWNPDRLYSLGKKCHQIAIDIKGNRETVETITGRPPEISFDRAVESLRAISKLNGTKTIEVRTPIFSQTTISELCDVAEVIPSNAYWILRNFTDDALDGDTTGINAPPYAEWAKPASESHVLQLHNTLLEHFPDLSSRLISLPGSARTEEIYEMA